MSERVERAIGQLAVEDFVTPPPTAFAKGCGEVTIAVYERWSRPKKNKRNAVIVHTRTKASNGCRVEYCLFGSIENCGLSPALRFGIVTDFCGVLVQSGRPVLR
jgi:hypothetical protein